MSDPPEKSPRDPPPIDSDTHGAASPLETGEAAPEEVFGLLADDIRVAILWALFTAHGEPMTFSELREATGVADSGQFNYHLGKLRGRFVRQGEDGYTLRLAGSRVIGAVLSGTYTREATVEPIPLETPCPACGGAVEAAYVDERATVACSECEVTMTSFSVPPGILDGHEREALPGVFASWVETLAHMTRRGFCYLCIGRMAPSLSGEPDPDAGMHLASYTCERCGETLTSAVGTTILEHPAVVAFHDAHGIDVTRVPFWELDWLLSAHSETVGTDPLVVRVTIELDGETMVVDVDETLDVVAVHEDGAP